MGIYDRDYARETWRPGSPTGWTWTKRIILANVVLFLAQLFFDSFFKAWFALHPEDVVGRGFVWQLVTYTFLHDTGGIFHLFFNMLFLWWFGSELEEAYGGRRFLALYTASGVFGGIAHVAAAYLWKGGGGYALGASACVMGVLALAALRDPRRIVYLWMIVLIPVQLRFLALFYVAVDFLGFARGGGGVAYAAHLGGAAWGALWWLARERGVSLGLPLRRRRRLKLVQPHSEDGPSPEMRAEVDRLLAKISTDGLDALTASEKQYLARVSREFRHN